MKWLAGWGAAILAVGSTPALATVPSPERVASAVASENSAADRTQPLRLELRVQIGDRRAVASGTLFVDPSGQARLELRGTNGLVERHLLQGGEVFATRNGEPLEEHRFFLPPLYVLQAGSGAALRRSLEELEIGVDSVGLSQCQEEDCLVVGDPELEIPRRAPPEVRGLELYEEVRALRAEEAAAEAAGFSLEEWREMSEALAAEGVAIRSIDDLASEEGEEGEKGEAGLDLPVPDSPSSQEPAIGPFDPLLPAEGGPLAAAPETGAEGAPVAEGSAPPLEVDEQAPAEPSPGLWVDRKSFTIRGMDSAAGVQTRLGPEAVYSGVRFPGWVDIQEPGKEAVRLHVLAISRAPGDPPGYGPEWLLEPQNPATGESGAPEGSDQRPEAAPFRSENPF